MLWLALDIGTTETKAGLIEAEGATLRIVRTASAAHETQTAEGGVIEQDANGWWSAACKAARELDAAEADAIALTGQMQDVILVDIDGEPIRPAILYSDSRAHAEAAWINAQVGRERLAHLTGYDQEAGSVLAKLRWLIAHDPTALNHAARMLLGAADVIASRLTNAAASDTTTAGTTGLLDLDSRGWLAAEVLDAMKLAHLSCLFPDVVAGGAQVGTAGRAAALALGVREGIPVHLGPGDAGATTLGIGAGVPGTAYGYIGTSGWVGSTSTQRGDPAQGVWTLPHPDPALLIGVAPLLTAAGNLDWAQAALGVPDIPTLIGIALDAAPSNLIYLPYLNGERSPIKDPFARGAFIGLSQRHQAGDMARAVLEGVALSYRHALDCLFPDHAVESLALTGGGTRSEGFVQLFADVTGVRVTLAHDPANTGLRGAVMAAQVARGERSDYRIAEQGTQTFTPDAQMSALYARKYGWFKEAYPALKGLYGQMNG